MSGDSARAGEAPTYNRDVRPILAENCFACHGPDKAARKARLRLDVRADAVKAGAFVPGKPSESALVERVFADEPSERMPPPRSHKKLTAAQKDLLKRWVATGARYEAHWSFIPPKRPPLPAVKNARWCRNRIDRFLLAELEKHGLTPAPEADRHTLARRLSLDLRGLPPSPAEVEAFVNDPRPGAYERLVDRLLASPAWGEHRGRYWLDAARYADTHGIHFDNYRETWAYRDWVLGAFNRNLPFDRFTLEQLAGDLLPRRSLEQLIASGFNRCNITTNEGGAIDEEYLVLYNRDRTETVSHVWMGLTANCAVCHDHKFDPITQKEFYSLAAFFNNTTQGAMDGNIKDTPPVITVPLPDDRPRWRALPGELAAARKAALARKLAARPDFDKWLSSAKVEAVTGKLPADALHLSAPLNEGSGNTLKFTLAGKPRALTLKAGVGWDAGHVADRAFKTQPGGTAELPDAGDFDKSQPFSVGAWVRLPNAGATGAVLGRMDEKSDFRGWDLWVEGGKFGMHFIHKWPTDALKVVAGPQVKANEWNHVLVTYDGSAKAAGLTVYLNGVAQADRSVTADALKNTTRTKVPLKIGQRNTTARLDNIQVHDLRIHTRALSAAEVGRLARTARAAFLVGKPAAKRTPAEKDELFTWWLTGQDRVYRSATAKLNTLVGEESAIKARGTVAHVAQDRPGKPVAHVLYRGDYDKRRRPGRPGHPTVLPPMPADLPRNRLGFAKWLLRDDHPLTARVTVNRYWQEVFGTGIVRTSGDFGTTGEPPSHPDLLDWLAVEFRTSGWDVKQFFRLLVTSAAYRQSSATTPEKHEKDPQNRLLSRGPRFRLDAELIRDYALAAGELLVPKLGGPSVKPYQPEGVWEAVAMIGSDTRDYRRDSGESLYRRSLYTFWKRAAPPASMEIFNAPSREFCTVRRERTNTPLQALVTLNDPQFVEAARHLAQNALKKGGDTVASRLDYMARRVLARPLRRKEQNVARRVLDELLADYKANPADAKKLLAVGESKADASLDAATLAGWTMLANSLLNLDEALNK